MLHFNFDECVGVFLQSLLGALAEHGQRIESLNQDERLQAISFDILPWDPYIGIAFRTLNEPIDTDHSADWVHSHFIGEINCQALHPALEFASNAYQAVLKEPGKCQEVAHLLFVAAAVALLDDRVAQLLQSFGVAAPTIGDSFQSQRHCFEYLVFDDDGVLRLNYCDLVRATRVTRRLLGRDAW